MCLKHDMNRLAYKYDEVLHVLSTLINRVIHIRRSVDKLVDKVFLA
ncbi:hypothetical protein VDIAB_30409 [Vibrio diabolicus]|nr:hypothetical protein VDIAB_30409 [Vibrio diabolicus]